MCALLEAGCKGTCEEEGGIVGGGTAEDVIAKSSRAMAANKSDVEGFAVRTGRRDGSLAHVRGPLVEHWKGL